MKTKLLNLLFIICSAFGVLQSANCNLYSQVQQEWVQRYPDTSGFIASAYALALDDSDNVYITGHVDFNNIPPYDGYCTIKYSVTGVQQWVANYYSNNSGGRFARAIALDKSSNVYVTGNSYENGNYFDFCTIKYNSNGAQQWIKFYDDPLHGDDGAEKIGIDNAGNIYVSGYSQVPGINAYSFTTIKYSEDGREIWVRTYINAGSVIAVNGMKIDDSCHVCITGSYGLKSVTIKYDSSGSQLWAKEYSGYGIGGQTEANSMSLDRNNNVYITGYSTGINTYSDYFTIKYSSWGVQQWLRRFNADSTEPTSYYAANSISLDDIGNIYVTGTARKNSSTPAKLCIIKYSNIGDLIWIRKDSAEFTNIMPTMTIDNKNNIYITGSMHKPFLGNTYCTLKYDSSGNQKWKQILNENGDSYPFFINVDNNYNVFVTGNSNTKMCTIKYSQPVGISKNNNQIPKQFGLFQNFPNPFNPRTIIKYELKVRNFVILRVYDISGKEIITLVSQTQNSGEYEIDFSGNGYSSGVYFYQLIIDNNIVDTKKMILLK